MVCCKSVVSKQPEQTALHAFTLVASGVFVFGFHFLTTSFVPRQGKRWLERYGTTHAIQLQGTSLDHHKLSLQLSKHKSNQASSSGGSKSGSKSKDGDKDGTPEDGSTKLVVRNVAFEATRK